MSAVDAKKKVEAIFSKWDKNGDGVIAIDKLQGIFSALGMKGDDVSKVVADGQNGFVRWQDVIDGLFSNGSTTTPHHDPDHPYHGEILHLRQLVDHLRSNRIISNSTDIPKPKQPTLVDNTILFIPPLGCHCLDIEPNMDDKGDKEKEMWYGRVWELRSLMRAKHQKTHKKKKDEGKVSAHQLTKEEADQLDFKCKDPAVMVRLKRMIAHWRGAHYRNHTRLTVLEKLRYANLMGTLVYAHGSGGMSWDNMRLCRQICKLGMLVIAPDGFAHPPESAMGQLRRKEVLPLTPAHANVDYWANDLIYASGAEGLATYSTNSANVLDDPDDYRDLYEKCYQLRRSELHLILSRLPLWIKTRGFFLGGTSEGGMTIARFDDQRYGRMVLGRFINSFSVEYCYFTPVPEAAEIGGQLNVPTLNIIGDADEYFGPVDSVASIVASDKEHGYGDAALTGNAFKTFVRQGMKVGLVTVLTGGMHGPCSTHDNFLRQLFETFFARPGDICYLKDIWSVDYTRSHLVANVEQSTLDDEVKYRTDKWYVRVVQMKVPKMRQPQSLSLKKVEAIRLAKASQTAQLDAQLAEQEARLEADRLQHKVMLDGIRGKSVAGELQNKPAQETYYSGPDKTTAKEKAKEKS